VIIFDDSASVRFVSRLDPRVRVAAVILFAVLICLCGRFVVLATGLAAGILLLLASGVTLWKAAQRLISLNAFMILLAVTMPLLVPGPTVFQFGSLEWSAAGLLRAAQVAARANAVMLMLTAMLGTLEAPHLGFALDGLGLSGKFTHLILFMVRYTEIIHHEYHHLRDAMLLRGFRPRTDRHTLRAFGYLIGQLLVRSVNRAERIFDAMKCRGFHGHFYVLHTSRIHRGDVVFAAMALAFISALLTMELQ